MGTEELGSVVIKPHLKKNFIHDFFIVIFLAIAFLVLLYLLNAFIGLEWYVKLFEFIGLTLNEEAVINISLIAVFIVSIITLIYDYVVLVSLRYSFYPGYLLYQQNISLVYHKNTKIPYENVTNIFYEEEGLLNKVFNTGTIILEVFGMKDKEIELKAVDRVVEKAKMIHNMVGEYQSRR